MIEVINIVDLYEQIEVEVDGEMVLEEKLIVEDLEIKKMTKLESLYPSQLYKKDGTIYEDRTRVYDDCLNDTYVVKGSYEDWKTRVLDKRKKMGFR